MLARRGLLVRARAPRLMAFVNGPQELTLTLSAPHYLEQFLMFARSGLLVRARTRILTAFVSGVQSLTLTASAPQYLW